jgi:hypothetical protein
MKSYLSERYFQVEIDYELSAYHSIRTGVPQDSILGPLLYLIFTADVPLTGKTLMATFADDTAIMSSDHDPNTSSQKLQQYLNLLPNWTESGKLQLILQNPHNIYYKKNYLSAS